MTPQEAYKLGFLLQCAREGLTPEQTERRIKVAAFLKQAGGLADLVNPAEWARKGTESVENLTDMFNNMWGPAKQVGFWSAVGVPAIAGGAAGYGLAQMRDDPLSPEEAKQEELIAEYRRAIGQLAHR